MKAGLQREGAAREDSVDQAAREADLVEYIYPLKTDGKAATTLDVLSGGRVRFGAAIGWNHVEYEALGMNWRDRAKRVEEQIEVLRLLWTQDLVDYTGRWHRIDRAGIKPLPIQRPIPIWMGADEEVAVKRVARLADVVASAGRGRHRRRRRR